jgi:hypothetical protein
MSTTTTSATHRLKGVNSDEHTCTLCGRTDLVRVAWLAPLDSDGNEIAQPSAYGTDCAGRLLHGTKNASNNERVKREGLALVRSARWLAEGHDPEIVANDARVRGVIAEITATGVRLLVSGDWVEISA